MCTTSFAVWAYAHDIIPQQLLLGDKLTTSLHYEGTSTILSEMVPTIGRKGRNELCGS